MSEDEQRRILRLLAIEKEQRRSHESLKKWATENFAILGHWKRAAEIKERAAENFSVLKSAPAKACSKKCTSGSRVSVVLQMCFSTYSSYWSFKWYGMVWIFKKDCPPLHGRHWLPSFLRICACGNVEYVRYWSVHFDAVVVELAKTLPTLPGVFSLSGSEPVWATQKILLYSLTITAMYIFATQERESSKPKCLLMSGVL